jgi:hypothetical protein
VPAIHRFLPSRRNAIALVGGFLLAFLLWWWKSGSRPASTAHSFSPTEELDRVVYAVSHARSWRVTTIGTLRGQPFQTDQDVLCPFDSYTITYTLSASGPRSVAEEFIETKDTLYAREGGQPWHSQANTSVDKCRLGPMAGPAPLVDTLDGLKRSTKPRKSLLVQSGGGACRLWDFFDGQSDVPLGSICVDEITHLPYELRLGALRVQYSNWNLPAAIEPPRTP